MRVYWWALLFTITISLVSSEPVINLGSETIIAGETVLGKITLENGTFSEGIGKPKLSFFEGRKEVFFEYDIIYYEGGDEYYFYVYTFNEGNWTLQIENIFYLEEETLKSQDLETELIIFSSSYLDEDLNETYRRALSIRPGFFFGVGTASISVSNAGDKELNFTYDGAEYSLGLLESQELLLTPKTAVDYFEISSYKDFRVPAIDPFFNGSLIDKSAIDLRSGTKTITETIVAGETSVFDIDLFNFGDLRISEITFLSGSSFVSFESVDDLGPRENTSTEISFNPKTPGNFEGKIIISHLQGEEAKNLTIPFDFIILPKGSDVENFTVKAETCSELGGDVCNLEEECNGDATFAKGGTYCCLGVCEAGEILKEGKGNSKTYWGILIFLFLGGIAYYFYQRSRKVVAKGTEDPLEKVSKKYDSQMKGAQGKKVSGGLGRV